ncbi:hypothetical protein LTR85_003102 [Meristemomyces frigidus]|nr:hypothetical protein LTR85_003102 [Meristemomyces frigidus]
MATAAQRVMALPELLENILQHLERKQLFVIQRLNMTLNQAVSESKTLRHIMFLEPTVVEKATKAPPSSSDDWLGFAEPEELDDSQLDGMLNPLLRKHAMTAVPYYQLHILDLGYGSVNFLGERREKYEVACIATATTTLTDSVKSEPTWRHMILTKNGWTAQFKLFSHPNDRTETTTFTMNGATELGTVADVIGELLARCRLVTSEGQARRIIGVREEYCIAGVNVKSEYDLRQAANR